MELSALGSMLSEMYWLVKIIVHEDNKSIDMLNCRQILILIRRKPALIDRMSKVRGRNSLIFQLAALISIICVLVHC
jgi:hypothetical protein